MGAESSSEMYHTTTATGFFEPRRSATLTRLDRKYQLSPPNTPSALPASSASALQWTPTYQELRMDEILPVQHDTLDTRRTLLVCNHRPKSVVLKPESPDGCELLFDHYNWTVRSEEHAATKTSRYVVTMETPLPTRVHSVEYQQPQPSLDGHVCVRYAPVLRPGSSTTFDTTSMLFGSKTSSRRQQPLFVRGTNTTVEAPAWMRVAQRVELWSDHPLNTVTVAGQHNLPAILFATRNVFGSTTSSSGRLRQFLYSVDLNLDVGAWRSAQAQPRPKAVGPTLVSYHSLAGPQQFDVHWCLYGYDH